MACVSHSERTSVAAEAARHLRRRRARQRVGELLLEEHHVPQRARAELLGELGAHIGMDEAEAACQWRREGRRLRRRRKTEGRVQQHSGRCFTVGRVAAPQRRRHPRRVVVGQLGRGVQHAARVGQKEARREAAAAAALMAAA